MQTKETVDTKRVAVVVLMVNGQPCQIPLTAFNDELLEGLKKVIKDELFNSDACCARREKLHDLIADINRILSQRATVALCRN